MVMKRKRQRYDSFSAKVIKSRRWKTLRYLAKRRDGWKCVTVGCGSRVGLEVDHIKGVRDAPELAFELSNLQTLCGRCHSRKTRIEVGLAEINPDRAAWHLFIKEISNVGICKNQPSPV